MNCFRLIIIIFCCAYFNNTKAQSTWDDVYTILKTNCATANCHVGAEPAGLLYFDLEKNYVHLQIVNQFPQNQTAAKDNNNRLIYAGDPYRSYIFRKINNGFTADVPLKEGEIDEFHDIEISKVEKELIRQWILFGAPDSGEVVKKSIIEEFYNGNGIQSVAEVPEPPANGFQIHIGPYFLPPGSEEEYFYKYPLDNLNDKIEVVAFDTKMGSNSHHFIIMKFWNSFVQKTSNGLRKWDRHDHATFEEVAQDNQRIELPKGSAFEWGKNTVLDLNTHYINYSSTAVLACDVYVNVETQSPGLANQLMRTQLIPDTTLFIPNNGELVELTDTFKVPLPNVYIWSLTSHAHKYSVDYDIFQPIPGKPSNHVYDASCPNGIPDCDNAVYDYERPPTRYFNPFLKADPSIGVIHKASYINTGPKPLGWTWTSDGEMMVFVMRYLLDTTGVEILKDPEVSSQNFANNTNFLISPNPSKGIIDMHFPAFSTGALQCIIYNQVGEQIENTLVTNKQRLNLSHLSKGIYFIELLREQKHVGAAKIVLE